MPSRSTGPQGTKVLVRHSAQRIGYCRMSRRGRSESLRCEVLKFASPQTWQESVLQPPSQDRALRARRATGNRASNRLRLRPAGAVFHWLIRSLQPSVPRMQAPRILLCRLIRWHVARTCRSGMPSCLLRGERFKAGRNDGLGCLCCFPKRHVGRVQKHRVRRRLER